MPFIRVEKHIISYTINTILLILGFLGLTGSHAFCQSKVDNDPSYSVNNYKHPNKVAYAKKNKLQGLLTVPEIMVVQNDNYKQSNRRVSVLKTGTVVSNDRYRAYPNDKHPKKSEAAPLNVEENQNAVVTKPLSPQKPSGHSPLFHGLSKNSG